MLTLVLQASLNCASITDSDTVTSHTVMSKKRRNFEVSPLAMARSIILVFRTLYNMRNIGIIISNVFRWISSLAVHFLVAPIRAIPSPNALNPFRRNVGTQSITTKPCRHICLNKVTYKHPCCKRHIRHSQKEVINMVPTNNGPFGHVLLVITRNTQTLLSLLTGWLSEAANPLHIVQCMNMVYVCIGSTIRFITSSCRKTYDIFPSPLLLLPRIRIMHEKFCSNVARLKKQPLSMTALEIMKLAQRIILWYIRFFYIQVDTMPQNDGKPEPETASPTKLCTSSQPFTTAVEKESNPYLPANPTVTLNHNEMYEVEKLTEKQELIMPCPREQEGENDEVPGWVFQSSATQNRDESAPPDTNHEPRQKQYLHFVQSRARPVKVRTVANLIWTYFPDIRNASESPLVRARITSLQAAQAALSKMLSGKSNSHDLVVEPSTTKELMDHRGCDYIHIEEQNSQHISRHASWTSLLQDNTLKLNEKYATAGALGRAVMKALNGMDIPHLRHLRITVHRRLEEAEEVSYERISRREASPNRIQQNRSAPTLRTVQPCRHTCRNKLECAHLCCKVFGPPYAPGNETGCESPTTVPSNIHSQVEPSTPTVQSDASQSQKAVELLQKHNAILGGKVTIRLSEEQWRQVEARASARCNELLSDTTDRKTAIRNAELLSAALAVSAYEIATEANPTRGFLIRASTGHARRWYRPLATERVAQELKHHLTTLKTSLRYTRSRTERDELRAQIKECRKLVRIREEEATKQREEIDQRWASERFSRNPWTAASETIDKPDANEVQNTTYPTCDRNTIETYFESSFKPSEELFQLPPPDVLGPGAAQPMHWDPITRDDVTAAINMKRNSSSPGADTITNLILKKCPFMHDQFAKVFNNLMTFSTCPPSWKTAITRLIHTRTVIQCKNGAPENPKNWRPISLTSALGKAFHTIISHRLTQHLIRHNVIDPKIQKGFLPEINGTLEHTQTLCTLLQHYQRHKRQYCLAQLDLTNAFGSIPHNIILASLGWAGIPCNVVDYIKDSLTDAHIRVKCYEGLTRPIHVKKGVLQGDTLSTTIFLVVMEIVLRYVRFSCPTFGMRLPNGDNNFLKAYADDLTILTESNRDMQTSLNALTTVLSKIGLKINVTKSRVQCMSTRKGEEHPGYMTRRPTVTTYGEKIPHICDAGSSFLGMTLAPGSQQLNELFKKLNSKLKGWLENTSASAYNLSAKLWIYRHAIISRLRFQFTIHPCISFSSVLRLQKRVTAHIRRWINMARAGSTEVLYSCRGWNLKSLTQLWYECTGTSLTQMHQSRDPNVLKALRFRIQEEQRKRAKGQIRLAAQITDHLNDPQRARQILRDAHEEQMITRLRQRAPVAALWWQFPSDPEMAQEFASAIHGIRNEKLSRFMSSVMTLTPLPSRVSLVQWGRNYHSDTNNKTRPFIMQHILTTREVHTQTRHGSPRVRTTRTPIPFHRSLLL